jgi:hypothetical protein
LFDPKKKHLKELVVDPKKKQEATRRVKGGISNE